MCRSRRWRVVELLHPTRLPNGNWRPSRTIRRCFQAFQLQKKGTKTSYLSQEAELSLSGRENWRFKPNHKALLNLTKWRLVPKPNRSISRASCKERSKTIQPKQSESRDLKKCSFAETLSLPIGMSTMNPSVLSSFWWVLNWILNVSSKSTSVLVHWQTRNDIFLLSFVAYKLAAFVSFLLGKTVKMVYYLSIIATPDSGPFL